MLSCARELKLESKSATLRVPRSSFDDGPFAVDGLGELDAVNNLPSERDTIEDANATLKVTESHCGAAFELPSPKRQT